MSNTMGSQKILNSDNSSKKKTQLKKCYIFEFYSGWAF